MAEGKRFLAKPKKQRHHIFKSIISTFFRWKGSGDQMDDVPEATKYALIYGGCGTVGSKCVHQFKMNNWWVASVDFIANNNADVNIMVSKTDAFATQENDVLAALASILQDKKLHVIICVTGGWVDISDSTESLASKFTDGFYDSTLSTSIICSKVAIGHLIDGGLFVISGAKSGLTPSSTQVVGYAAAKAAINYITKKLIDKETEKHRNVHIIALLPTVLDTSHKKTAGNEVYGGTFTSLQFFSELLLRWANGKDRPPTGSLCQLITSNYNTDVLIV